MGIVASLFCRLEHFLRLHIPEIVVLRPEATFLVWMDCAGLGLGADELDKFMISEVWQHACASDNRRSSRCVYTSSLSYALMLCSDPIRVCEFIIDDEVGHFSK